MVDRYHLQRFVDAQNSGGVYDCAVAELLRGRKKTHWMWFVFPQIAGLGRTETSKKFAISSLEEARAYLQHPVLGARLIECAGIVAASESASATDIFGCVDARKLQSSMTLFRRADPDEPVFGRVLDSYFRGRRDAATDKRVGDI